MLTARTSIDDRIGGLDADAVDYMTKPFAFDELAMRLRAHLRTPARRESTRRAALRIELHLLTRQVRRDGVTIFLSGKEFDLLGCLMRSPRGVVSREQILSAAWGSMHHPTRNIVEVCITYLRRKVGRPKSPAPVVTVRSVGHQLAAHRA